MTEKKTGKKTVKKTLTKTVKVGGQTVPPPRRKPGGGPRKRPLPPPGPCDLLDEFARLCEVSDPRELRTLAAAGDCQFDHRCPEARECPVARQALYKPRKIMILPYNDKHQPYQPEKNGCGTASVDFSDFWY